MPGPTSPDPAPVRAQYKNSQSLVRVFLIGWLSALLAGLLVAVWEYIDYSERGFSALTTSLALTGVVSFGIGLFFAALVTALHHLWGPSWLARAARAVSRDRQKDGLWTARALAFLVGMSTLHIALGVWGGTLLNFKRKGAAAALMGFGVLPCLLIAVCDALIIYALIRRPLRKLPSLPYLPNVFLVLTLALVWWGFRLRRAVVNSLEVDALPLSLLAAVEGLLLFTIVIYLVLSPVVRSMSRPRFAVLVGALTTILWIAPLLSLTSPPSERVANSVVKDSQFGATIVSSLRKARDADGDGYSAFFRGPDCDDSNPKVLPGGTEVPNNNIDEDCLGGDLKVDGPIDKPATDVKTPTVKRVDNVLIVLIDTVRADRPGYTGYKRRGVSLTPHLDALAQKSAVFTSAYAQSPRTPRSAPSILTGRFPSRIAFEGGQKSYPKVLDENQTVFELAQQAGIETHHYSSHFYFRDDRNLQQGIDVFNNEGALDIAPSNKDVASPRIIPRAQKALAQLATSKKRFAMFVHLFEPHSSYMKHAEYPLEGASSAVGKHMEKYDYEIAFTDGWLGKLLDALRTNGLADNTMVVILSDHGESFGDRRISGRPAMFHGTHLYEEVTRVPLVIHLPGATPRSIATKVMLVDIAPTVLAALGIEAKPDSAMDGVSLVPAITKGKIEQRPIYSELLPYRNWPKDGQALITADGRYKIYRRTKENILEIFDLVSDPKEADDLSQKDPALRKRLEQELSLFQLRLKR